MRVAGGTSARAGAPAAVISSGSRGVLTPGIFPDPDGSAGDLAERGRHREQRVDAGPVPAVRDDLGARADAPALAPLDVDEPAKLDPVARGGRRERERRAAEDAAAAVRELGEAALAA